MSACHLALDTATEACSAALWIDGAVLERFEVAERGHTALLLPMIRALLAEAGRTAAQLDGLACGIGPGSFAGVRIGVGVAKGLALARGLPVVPVSSLAMLAQGEFQAGGATHVAAAIDARMGEVYYGSFARGRDGRAEPLGAETVCPPAQAPRLPPGVWRGVGTGWAAHGATLRDATAIPDPQPDGARLPRAADALALALPLLQTGNGVSAEALAPSYLRERVALTLAEQAAARQRAGG